jgi:hypothetical protein
MSFGNQSIRYEPMPGASTSPTVPSVRPIGPFLGSAGAASSRHSRNGDGPIIGDRVPCPAIESLRTVDLGHSSDGPSWIDLVALRLNTTESRFLTCLNRLLQQNPPIADLRASNVMECYLVLTAQSGRDSAATRTQTNTLSPSSRALAKRSLRGALAMRMCNLSARWAGSGFS